MRLWKGSHDKALGKVGVVRTGKHTGERLSVLPPLKLEPGTMGGGVGNREPIGVTDQIGKFGPTP